MLPGIDPGEGVPTQILDVLDGKGGAIKKKEDTHKMAQANMVFSHFRW